MHILLDKWNSQHNVIAYYRVAGDDTEGYNAQLP